MKICASKFAVEKNKILAKANAWLDTQSRSRTQVVTPQSDAQSGSREYVRIPSGCSALGTLASRLGAGGPGA